MRLQKDANGKIYTHVNSPEQIDLCDYVYVNGRRFDFDRRKEYRHPVTGHDGYCTCFMCNH
jgi:hypothetical protein